MTTDSQKRISDGWEEMNRVIHALVLREIKTRFGTRKLGYIWALLEPIFFVTILVFIFSFRRRYVPESMGLELFMITGIVPFFLFRHIMSVSITALSSNQKLLTYPQVQVNDIVFARFILEFSTSVIVFILLVAGVHLLEIDVVDIESLHGILLGFCMLGLFGLGTGLFFSALYPIIPSIKSIADLLLGRPLFFTSGVFYSAEMLPGRIRDVLMWNPLFHVIEYIRQCFFKGFESQYIDLAYASWFLLIVLFLGFLTQRALIRYALILR